MDFLSTWWCFQTCLRMREWCKEIPLHLEVVLESERAPKRLHVCLWVSTVSAYCICWRKWTSHLVWNWLKSKPNPLQTCQNSPGNSGRFVEVGVFFLIICCNQMLLWPPPAAAAAAGALTIEKLSLDQPVEDQTCNCCMKCDQEGEEGEVCVCVCVCVCGVETIWQKGRALDVRGVRLCCSICAGFIKCRTGLVR